MGTLEHAHDALAVVPGSSQQQCLVVRVSPRYHREPAVSVTSVELAQAVVTHCGRHDKQGGVTETSRVLYASLLHFGSSFHFDSWKSTYFVG